MLTPAGPLEAADQTLRRLGLPGYPMVRTVEVTPKSMELTGMDAGQSPAMEATFSYEIEFTPETPADLAEHLADYAAECFGSCLTLMADEMAEEVRDWLNGRIMDMMSRFEIRLDGDRWIWVASSIRWLDE